MTKADKNGWIPIDAAPLETPGFVYSPEPGMADRTEVVGTVHASVIAGKRIVSSNAHGWKFTHWHPLLKPPVIK